MILDKSAQNLLDHISSVFALSLPTTVNPMDLSICYNGSFDMNIADKNF